LLDKYSRQKVAEIMGVSVRRTRLWN